MIVRTISGTLSALTLGLVGLARSAGTIDDQKNIVPVQVEKKTETPKKSINSHIEEIFNSRVENHYLMINNLPSEIKIELGKELFKQTCEEFKKDRKNVREKIYRTKTFLYSLPKSELKKVLEKNFNEYRKLIEVYMEIVENPVHKHDPVYLADYDEIHLCAAIDYYVSTEFPPKLFNKDWYPRITDLIKRLAHEDSKRLEEYKNKGIAYQVKEGISSLICQLAVAELKKDSGIETPRIFNDLLKLSDNNPKISPYILRTLLDICTNEAFVNSTETNKRHTFKDFSHHVIPDELLIKPIEERVKKIVSNPPGKDDSEEVREIYDDASKIAGKLFNFPFRRKECAIIWHNKLLEKISESKIDDVPGMITALNSYSFNFLGSNHNEIFKEDSQERSQFVKKIIRKACDSLKTLNSTENNNGKRVIDTLLEERFVSNYLGPGIPDFTNDKDVNNLIIEVLRSAKDRKVCSKEIYLQTSLNFLRLSSNKAIVKEVFDSFSTAINDSHNENKELTDEQKITLLRYCNDLMKSVSNINLDIEGFNAWLEGANLLYPQVSEKVISGSSNIQVLSSGFNFLINHNCLPNSFKNEEKKLLRFVDEVVVNKFFKSILESSKNLNESDMATFKEEILWNMPSIFLFEKNRKVTNKLRYESEPSVKKSLDLLANNYFSDSKGIKGLEEISAFLKISASYNSQAFPYYNFFRGILLKTLSHNKEHVQTVVKDVSSDLKSKKGEDKLKTIEALLEYWEKTKHISSIHFEPNKDRHLKDIISNEQVQQVDTLLKTTRAYVEDVFLEHLNTANVTIDFIPNSTSNIFYDKEFQLEINTIKKISKNASNDFNSKLLELVSSRLKAETNPYNRGMLYKALTILPPDVRNKDGQSITDIFRNGIVNEKSTITARYIGKALGEVHLNTIFGDISESSFYYAAGSPQSRKWISNVCKNIQGINKYLNHKQSTKHLLSTITRIAHGHGDGLSDLLTDSLGYSNFRSEKEIAIADNKEGKPVNITKDIARTRRNAKAVLVGLGQSVHEKSKSTDLAKITNSHDPKREIGFALSETLAEITTAFKSSINFNTFDSMPYHTAAMVELYRLDDYSDLDQKVQELNSKIFNGETDFSIFERYEYTLLSNLSFEYSRKDNNFYKTSLGGIWEHITGLKHKDGVVISNEGLSNEEKYKRFKTSRELLHRESKELNKDLYLKEVQRPLIKTKEDFVRKFLKDVPNRKLEEYIGVLREWRLLRDIGQIEWNLILDDIERTHKVWADGNR